MDSPLGDRDTIIDLMIHRSGYPHIRFYVLLPPGRATALRDLYGFRNRGGRVPILYLGGSYGTKSIQRGVFYDVH